MLAPRFGPAIPQIKGEPAYPSGTAGLPRGRKAFGLNAAISKIIQITDMTSGFSGNAQCIEQCSVIAVVAFPFIHHLNIKPLVFIISKPNLLHRHIPLSYRMQRLVATSRCLNMVLYITVHFGRKIGPSHETITCF